MSFPGAGVWKGQCSVTFIEGHQSDNKIGKYPFVMASQPSRLLCHHRRRRLLLTQDTASLPMLATLGCHIPRVLVAPTFHACTLCLVGTDGTVVIDQDVAGLSQLIHCLTLAREESVGLDSDRNIRDLIGFGKHQRHSSHRFLERSPNGSEVAIVQRER